MADYRFERPIFIRQKNYIQEVTNIDDAFDLLEEWPGHRRDLTYDTALKACRDGYVGRIPLSAVDETLRRFARKAGALVDIEEVPNFSISSTNRSMSRR